MKLLRLFSVLVIIIILVTCTACGTGYKPFEAALIEKAELYEIPEVNSVIMEDGKILWESNYGDNARDDGIYCIGSVSKSFVAVLALMLKQEGKISLNDTIGDYLQNPELKSRSAVTLRELLTMKSGIADYTDGFDKEDYFREYSEDELIAIGLSHSAFLKQGDFNYSNTNIIIAGQMIEKAMGASCEALIKEKILAPAGLENTYFADDKQTIHNRIIPGYSNTNASEKVDFTETTTSWSGLACGMYSTDADMAKWGDFLMNSPLISEDSRKELFASTDSGNGFDYGLCVLQKQINGKTVTVLQGNVPGYGSAVYIFDNTVLCVLCNLSDYGGRSISYAEETAKAIMAEVIS